MCMFVCVCASVREREERERSGKKGQRESKNQGVKAIWAQISQSLKNSLKPFGVN